MEDVDDRVDLMDMSCYEDASYDVIICMHVLEHVPDDRRALSELSRVLKPDGWGVIMVPICVYKRCFDEDVLLQDEDERWRRFGQNDHVRMYSKEVFLERLAASGFAVHQYGANFFGEKWMTRCGISTGSVLYVVRKQESLAGVGCVLEGRDEK
jgi:SAM-dependent methyltransferase